MSLHKSKRWIFPATRPELQCALSRALNISPVIAGLLINRGITTVEEARRFFNCKLEDLSSPWEMQGVKDAVARIMEARKMGEKVAVFGDYDVDGITGTALLVEALRELKFDVTYHIPHRLDEGYGPNCETFEKMAHNGSTLVITVDCGITAIDEIEFARRLGIDVIVTDHHQPFDELPPAFAVINPKIEEEDLPYYDLAGVGVVFKLVQALWEETGKGLEKSYAQFSDLVALGTIADIVPLIKENRILVKNGLEKIFSSNRKGLKALIEVAGIDNSNIDAKTVAFGLAPRLNAAGRIGDAYPGVELLITTSSQKAAEIAKFLHKENQKRQILESHILKEAELAVENEFDPEKDRIIVIASPSWHPGVIGIVASRLLEKYYRPVIIIALEGNEGRGSARSIAGFDIYSALKACEKHLKKYGGHPLAAGLAIEAQNIKHFKRSINEYASKHLKKEMLIPPIFLDGEILFYDLNEELLRQIDLFSPFGEGNPYPLFAYRGAHITECRPVGKGKKHLKMSVFGEGRKFESIGFDMVAKAEIAASKEVDLAFNLEENFWQGKKSIQLKLHDIQKAGSLKYPAQLDGEFTLNISTNEGEKYLLQGQPRQITGATLELIKKYVKEDKKLLIVGSTPGLSGFLFASLHKILGDNNIPHWHFKASFSGKQFQTIKETLNENHGILFTDMLTYKSLKKTYLYEACDHTIILGAKIEGNKIDGLPLMEDQKTTLMGYLFGNGINTTEKFKILQLSEQKNASAIYKKCTINDIIDGEKTIIFCSTIKEVLDITSILFDNYKRKVAYLHPGLSINQQKLVEEMFRQDVVSILIATTSTISLDRLENVKRVYFHTLPLDSVHHDFLITGCNEGIKEMLLDEHAAQKTKNIIESMFPSRNTLSEIYLFFKNNGWKNIKGCLYFLRENNCPRATGETIKVARAVFKELGINGLSSKKVNLEDSWRYQIIKKQHERFQSFLELLKLE